jgi:hypothetical protein
MRQESARWCHPSSRRRPQIGEGHPSRVMQDSAVDGDSPWYHRRAAD